MPLTQHVLCVDITSALSRTIIEMPAATVGEEEEEEEEEVKETEGPKRREWRVDIRCASLAATHCNTL